MEYFRARQPHVFDKVDGGQISHVESYVRQMLDKKLEVNSLKERANSISAEYQKNLQDKVDERNKRMFKVSYIKMRQQLDKQLEMTRTESIDRTVNKLKA